MQSKTILVSLRKINDEGIESFDTFFGRVTDFDQNKVRVLRQNGNESALPYDEDIYEVAEPGFYELEDGSTFENPDYIARWTVFASENAARRYREMNQP